MKAPHHLVYFDIVEEVHIPMRKDQGEAPAKRLAAYFQEVLGVPAEAHWHHSNWHLNYPVPGSYNSINEQLYRDGRLK